MKAVLQDDDAAYIRPDFDDDCDIDRVERRGLLPPTPTAAAGSRPSARRISIRRKQHDLRLRAILSSSEEEVRRKDDWMRPYWLGFALFLILYSFWILDTLKDPIFGALTGGSRLQYNLPRAKLLSVFTTLFLVVLLEYVAKEQRKQLLISDDSIGCKQDHVRSSDDVMDAGGTWTRMSIGQRNHSSRESRPRTNHHRSQIFVTIGAPFCIIFGTVAYLLQFNPNTALTAGLSKNSSGGSDATTAHAWRVLGYCTYAAIESFGSLMVATFWSYTNSTLTLHDAESYYGTIIAFAQMGAIAGSTMVTLHVWNSITLYIVACLVLVLHIIVMVTYDKRFPPTRPGNAELETTTADHNPSTIDDESIFQMAGIRLILKHNYVLLILGASCLYEVSLTCLNYQMTLLGWSRFEETVSTFEGSTKPRSPDTDSTSYISMMSFTQFMGHYGQMVNLCSLLLSSFVFPALIQRLGLKFTLRMFPTLLLCANLIAFVAFPGNLMVLFLSMSLLKATTYSIHDPAKEILYIPTSHSIQFQAKFWIDVVGARVAKAIGSSINHISGSVHRSIRVASGPSLITAIALWYICYLVGIQFDDLIERRTIVGIDDESSCSPYLSTHYSDEHDVDGDGCGTLVESTASLELTAL
jgi:ATP/ADP translocase